jgi:hypothetical protein
VGIDRILRQTLPNPTPVFASALTELAVGEVLSLDVPDALIVKTSAYIEGSDSRNGHLPGFRRTYLIFTFCSCAKVEGDN